MRKEERKTDEMGRAINKQKSRRDRIAYVLGRRWKQGAPGCAWSELVADEWIFRRPEFHSEIPSPAYTLGLHHSQKETQRLVRSALMKWHQTRQHK